MEKYFSSTFHSGKGTNKYMSGFNSMITLSPNQKPKDPLTNYKAYQDRSIGSKGSTFKKLLNKTYSLMESSDPSNLK